MAATRTETLREITQDYLTKIDASNPPSPIKIQEELLEFTSNKFQLENTLRPKQSQWKLPQELAPAQIADILMKLHHVVNIAYGGLQAEADYDVLSVYQTDGEDEGIYTSGNKMFYALIRTYNYTISERDIKETISLLKAMAPRAVRNDDRNIIAVNNGLFDYDTKQLLPFNPDIILTSKSKVDYNPNAQNTPIHNPDDNTNWDIESWIDDLFDGNTEMTELIWQIIGAIIRPNVKWNKSAWLLSSKGNNGKGTLCELMRQIAGDGTYASIPLSDFAKDFMLEQLVKSSCIIVDENDVGLYIDKAANLKAIITNDVFQMNRKHKSAIAFQFKGFMVQCLNEMPKMKDKSESFYRRQLIIPFTKCFTGMEKKYIKDDYMHRTEVLEYVLYKVLHMDYYTLSEPAVCQDMLKEYKEYNDPIRQFAEEMLPRFVWDLVPYSFIYDLYKAWFKKVSPTGTIVGRNTFVQEFKNLADEKDEWQAAPGDGKVKTGQKMNKGEPLIAEYKLEDWYNPLYKGDDAEKIGHPDLAVSYRGIIRV